MYVYVRMSMCVLSVCMYVSVDGCHRCGEFVTWVTRDCLLLINRCRDSNERLKTQSTKVWRHQKYCLEPGQFTLISMGLIWYSCGHISSPHEPIPTKFGVWRFYIMLYRNMKKKNHENAEKNIFDDVITLVLGYCVHSFNCVGHVVLHILNLLQYN